MVDELAHLRAELRVEKQRRKWRDRKHTPERQCTATTRKGKRCEAPRAPRDDGTLAPTCRVHGGSGWRSLESQARSLEALLRNQEKCVEGLKTKLAELREAVERERIMASTVVDSLVDSTGLELGLSPDSPQDSADSPPDRDAR